LPRNGIPVTIISSREIKKYVTLLTPIILHRDDTLRTVTITDVEAITYTVYP
jgi:hypothetical protein